MTGIHSYKVFASSFRLLAELVNFLNIVEQLYIFTEHFEYWLTCRM